MKKKSFILIGAAGYIAKKHVEAIKKCGGKLIAISDPHDNVGYIDNFFEDTIYFKNTNSMFNFLKKKKINVDYASICSPNYLHYEHIKLALKNSIQPICEKPVVINYIHFKKLIEISKKKQIKINLILQLRLNPIIEKIRSHLLLIKDRKINLKLTYITPRGKWYLKTWKIKKKLSGGISLNIGVHLFDILIIIFGKVLKTELIKKCNRELTGIVYFKSGFKVKIFLSIDKSKLLKKNLKSLRVLKINDKEFELSKSFKELHYLSYKKILNNKGFVINDFEDSLKLAYSFVK